MAVQQAEQFQHRLIHRLRVGRPNRGCRAAASQLRETAANSSVVIPVWVSATSSISAAIPPACSFSTLVG